MKPIEISTSLFVTIAVEDKDHCHADCEHMHIKSEPSWGNYEFCGIFYVNLSSEHGRMLRCQACKTAFADVEAHYLAIAQNKCVE